VLDMIRQLLEEGCDLILVTHEMGFARTVADRIAFVAEGRIVECQETKALFNAPSTEQCRKFLATVLRY
jgi:ABC-type polar amino acid transport system ATPase subunit